MKKSALVLAVSVVSAGFFLTYALAGDGNAAPNSAATTVSAAEVSPEGACTVASGDCTAGAAELKACNEKKEAGSCTRDKAGCDKKGEESCEDKGKDQCKAKGGGCPGK